MTTNIHKHHDIIGDKLDERTISISQTRKSSNRKGYHLIYASEATYEMAPIEKVSSAFRNHLELNVEGDEMIDESETKNESSTY